MAYEFILKLDKNKSVKCTEGNSRLAEFILQLSNLGNAMYIVYPSIN